MIHDLKMKALLALSVMEDEPTQEPDRNLRNALRRLLERYIQLAQRRKQAANKKKTRRSVLEPSANSCTRRVVAARQPF
jgi:hypothetical protein